MTIGSTSDLAMEGGPKVRQKDWPQWPIWDETEEKALLDVLHSGRWWSPDGRWTAPFEQEFAQYHDTQHGVTVSNGTTALTVSLLALNIGHGDEVIIPPYTFIATAGGVLSVSATPVFVDIEPRSLNMDPARIEEAITPRTKAIIPVHVAGCPADMDGVLEVARKHNLYVIEDAAQAHGAEWKGRKVGAHGHLGTFSFQASKNLNSGEGGMIVSNDERLSEYCRTIMNSGRVRQAGYETDALCGNYRITEWQSAILRSQFQRLPAQIEQRAANATYLTSLLDTMPGIITLPPDPRVTCHAYHLYMFRYNPAGFGNRTREEFLTALRAEGVPCRGGYMPLYKQRIFQNSTPGTGPWCPAGRTINYAEMVCPECERASADSVWLTQNLLLGPKEDMDDIAAAIGKIQAAWSGS